MNKKDKILLKYLIKSLLQYYIKNKYNILPLPKIILNFHNYNKNPIFTPTGEYNKNSCTIKLYCFGRHIKDILRSLSHELIHHQQNINKKLDFIISTDDIKEDDKLLEIEKDAFLNGNIIFRNWTTHEKNK